LHDGSIPFDFHVQFANFLHLFPKMQNDYELSFPALRGVQAGKEYYVAMCPIKLVVGLIKICDDDEGVPAELRAQRTLNKARIPAITDYILQNSNSYAFSSLTVSIDSSVEFVPFGNEGLARKMGILKVPYGVTYLINDGQHRRAALEQALKEKPELCNETISLVIYIDQGLKRSQQLFADLNRYAIRPTTSLSILYDNRDPMSRLMQDVVDNVPIFRDLTEKTKTTISNRSRKLFTLSVLYQSTAELLRKKKGTEPTAKDQETAVAYWTEVGKNITEWQQAAERKVATSDLRRDCIHAHGIALRALGRLGVDLLASHPNDWKKKLSGLKKVDWGRQTSGLWEGRAMTGGRISKAHNNILLTANVLKKAVGLPLNPQEVEVEAQFKRR
jgi:DNA sulfur modification protein DndB